MREFLSTQPAASALLSSELQEAYNRIQAIWRRTAYLISSHKQSYGDSERRI
jgi:hypothetical protein